MPLPHLLILESIHIAHAQTLQLTVQNNDVADITVIGAPYWIDFIEIFAQDGNVRMQRIEGHSIPLDMRKQFSTQELARLIGVTGPDLGTVILAAGEQRDFFLPFNSIIDTTEMFVAGLNGDLIYRFHFRAGTDILAGGAAPPTMNSLSLIIHTIELPPRRFRETLNLFRNGTFDYPYLFQVRQALTQTFNPGTTYNFVLSGLTGLVSFMHINMRATPLQNVAFFTYEKLDSFNILSESGHTITGLQKIDADYNIRVQQTLWGFPGESTVDNYLYAHSRAPINDIGTGSNLGFFAYTGKEQLQIITPSTMVAGNKELEVIAYVHGLLRINKGVARVILS